MACADSALDKIGFGKFQWVTLILSGIGFGAATVELVAVSQIKPFIQQKWKLETQSLGLMSTTTFLGEIIGGIVWAHLSDKHGREKVFLATSCLMFLFSLLLPFCWTFWQFCWMRLALGFAIGGGLSVDFVYFIECVPPRNRSFRSAFIILIGIAGGRNEYLFISYVFKYLFFSTLVLYSACSGLLLLNRFGYKSFLAACSIPSAILLLGRCFWRYESPKYLAARGKLREAENLLQEIAKINGAEHKLGYFELTPVHKTEEREKSDPKESFKGHWLLISLASVCFFCQTSAYYGLTLWMSQFLRPWGVSPSQMLLMVGLAEIPGLIVTTLLLKYYSQANGVLLCFNFGIASALSLIIFLASDTKSFVLSFCALYFCIVSIWTILYVHIPEGFPTLYRSRCFAIAGTFGKLGGMSSPILFGLLFGQSENRFLIHVIVSCLFLTGAVASIAFKHK